MKTNREFFTASGKPDPEKQAELEKAGTHTVERLGRDPRMERLLAEVDFELLKNIIETHTKRAGIKEKALNIIYPDRIAHRSIDPDATGSYEPSENVIGISYDKIQRHAEKLGLDEVLIGSLLLTHEEIHATSRVECRGLETPLHRTGDRVDETVGYARRTVSKDAGEGGLKVIEIYNLIDEGIVQKLAREIFFEYARARGYPENKIKAIEKSWQNHPDKVAYGKEIIFVEKLIDTISAKTGTSPIKVWESFIRGLYEGEDLTDKELNELFAEYISPDFLKKLAHANTSEALELLFTETFLEK